MNHYIDTRSSNPTPQSFAEVIVQGLAPSGGLFVPQTIPTLSLTQIEHLAHLSYPEQAAAVYQLFDTGFADHTVRELMNQAYHTNFDTPEICPVVSLSQNTHILELFHGPTSAFKDMALQCLPLFFSEALTQQVEHTQALILVATSGDTGKAALEGFKDKPRVRIGVFYPHEGVSQMQHLQMATQEGKNLFVTAINGNFDDCQRGLKQIFCDKAFGDQLMTEHGTMLSSANSINWGRLMPQIVYYVSAYAQMVARGSIELGDLIDICVPTGNFGNILAAYYSKQMGLPIARLICASNENDVLTDFLNTGVYDITSRPFMLTPSPSMDILISSNLERQLFESCGRDQMRVCEWMTSLSHHGRFEIDDKTFAHLKQHFVSGSAHALDCFAQIKETFEQDHYLLDPHTAVALCVARKHQTHRPLLIAATAHWAKFGASVARALHGLTPTDSLPPAYRQLSEVQLNRQLLNHAQDHGCTTYVPHNLDSIEEKPVRFTEVIDNDLESMKRTILTHQRSS